MKLKSDFLPFLPAVDRGVDLSELLTRVKDVIDNGLPLPVWVRAEISELRAKNGHLYLTLAQRNERGDVLAQARAIVWRQRAVEIMARFAQVTGRGLQPDIKILCLARVQFNVLYGLSLIIDDVDPVFTLGDLAAKLGRIREELKRAGLYELNQALAAPEDFVRVAVISPETSAGLGDFRRETDRLQNAGLCDFRFFEATFQGMDAPASITRAIRRALAAHREGPFDALVIIRGGGSVTDLAWLNDLELARLAAGVPVPLITGIGHERDSTILDEIANRRFDTPSKVALYITTTIRDRAFGALQSLERIKALAGRVLAREKMMLQSQADRIRSAARSALRVAQTHAGQFLIRAQTASRAQIHLAAISLTTERTRVLSQARAQLRDERLGLESRAQTVRLTSQASIAAGLREVAHLRSQVVREANRMTAGVRDEVERARGSLAAGAPAHLASARREVESLARIIVGLGPEATLQRGFAIARDRDDRPLASREAALANLSFRVQFRDGRVAVINQDFEGASPP
jgi:exodeoxyribonuclease VII large subunit